MPKQTKKKKFAMLDRKVACSTCGHVENVKYESSVWDLTSSCPKCAAILADFPVLYSWVTAVIEKNRLTEDRVRDIIDDRLNPHDSYY